MQARELRSRPRKLHIPGAQGSFKSEGISVRLDKRARGGDTWRGGRTGRARKGRPSKLGDPDYSSMEVKPAMWRAGDQSPTGARKQAPAQPGKEQASAQEVGRKARGTGAEAEGS
jgi:hypothetical protein